MQFKDVYTRIILTIIAICLIALVLQTGLDVFTSSANARLPKHKGPKVDVFPIASIPAEDIQQVITLGDQHTFILQLKDGVKVFRVDYVRD
ncbi:hypothetical protein J7M23_04135 [Candidatus Sumerlaeota bacterium]|nr:hypothetical protein [Candidatus Sumerlaeota bacterium]